MKNWIPVPGSKKETIIRLALEEFNKKGYEEVNIKELAKKANMTTGVIYHHFGSKANLYTLIRNDVEQRILDRMEGAITNIEDTVPLEVALLSGYDATLKLEVCKLLSEANPHGSDKISEFIQQLCIDHIVGLEHILIPSWRSLLQAVEQEKVSPEQGRNLLRWFFTKDE